MSAPWRLCWGLVLLATFSPPARAHGDEFLVLMAGSHVLWMAIACAPFLWGKSLRHRRSGAILGFLAGAAAAWGIVATGKTRELVFMLVWFGLPVVGMLAGVFVQSRRARSG
jgi:hypothetical protein